MTKRQPSSGGTRSAHRNKTSGRRAEHKPATPSDHRPTRADNRPTGTGDRSNFRDKPLTPSATKPARSDHRPTRADNRPTRTGDRSNFRDKPLTPSATKPARSDHRSTRADNRPTGTGDRSNFRDKPLTPSATKPTRSDHRPARNTASAPRPGTRRGAAPSRHSRQFAQHELHASGVASAERSQKVLARLGLGSRREIERWIAAGQVRINGRKAELGDLIKATDSVTVNRRRVHVMSAFRKSTARVLLYHKPVGQVVSRSDPETRDTVFESLPKLKRGRWIAIGRLDVATSGLLLFTDDGDFAHKLMHPKFGLEREYAIRIHGKLESTEMAKLCDGIVLEDGMAQFEHIRDEGGLGANHWYKAVLKEGRNREIRRLFEALGYTVSRLIRVRYADINLPRNLPRGRFRYLTPKEVSVLQQATDKLYDGSST